MNRNLALTVLSAFREPDASVVRNSVRRFGVEDWKNTLYWLDASGLALYFLTWAKKERVEDAIPTPVWRQLEQRLADNQVKTAFFLDEFYRLNQSFQVAGIQYANLKGPSLVP